jgi:predicted transposase/invertase (TIGR01784 family)
MKRKLITFDWALKRLLRSKANFDVLEGFLSELLKDDIEILEVLESEANKDSKDSKLNRVDLKVINKKKEIIIIEVQYDREIDYLHRILFGTSKIITEHLLEPEPYCKVVKVISVNILYFDLGQGADYVYHGITHFQGLHYKDELKLTERQQEYFNKTNISEIYPEYYLIKVNRFNDIAKDTLDEWIYFLKNEEIKDEFKAKGLKKAKEIMDVLKLSDEERQSYERYIDNLRYEASMLLSHYEDGRQDGREEGKIEVAVNLLDVLDDNTISEKTGLTLKQVKKLREKDKVKPG